MPKIGQSGGFLGRLLGPLLKTELPLMRNALKPLAKSVLTPLGLTPAASAVDAAIQKTMFGSGHPSDLASFMTILIISNEKINAIMKIVKLLYESGLLIKGVGKKIKNEAKEQKDGFLRVLLGTLGASLLGDILTGKSMVTAAQAFIMSPYPLTKFEMHNY